MPSEDSRNQLGASLQVQTLCTRVRTLAVARQELSKGQTPLWIPMPSPRDHTMTQPSSHTCLLKGNGNQDISGDRNLQPGASKEPLKRENTWKAFSLLNKGPQLLLLLITSRVRPLTNRQDVAGSSFAREACHGGASNYLSSYTRWQQLQLLIHMYRAWPRTVLSSSRPADPVIFNEHLLYARPILEQWATAAAAQMKVLFPF